MTASIDNALEYIGVYSRSDGRDPNAALIRAIIKNIDNVSTTLKTNVSNSNQSDSKKKTTIYCDWIHVSSQLEQLFAEERCIYYSFINQHSRQVAEQPDTLLILNKVNQMLKAVLDAKTDSEISEHILVLDYLCNGTNLKSSLPVLRLGALRYFMGDNTTRSSFFQRVLNWWKIGSDPIFHE